MPDGWKLAPVEPTREMIAAGVMQTMRADEQDEYRARGEAISTYLDMLAAAPSAPERKPLTYRQVMHLLDEVGPLRTNDQSDAISFARAIEQAHGIGEKA